MILLLLWIQAFITMLLIITLGELIPNNFASLVIILSTSACILAFMTNINKKYGLVTLTNLFLLGFVIVYFLVPLNLSLGFRLSSKFEYLLSMSEKENRLVVITVASSILLFIVGWYAGKWKVSHYSNTRKELNGAMESGITKYQKINLKPLELLTILIFLLFILSSGSYGKGVYTATDRSALSTYLYFLFQIVFTSTIILYYIKNQGKQFRSLYSYFKSYSILIRAFYVVFVLLMLWIGDRGPVIFYSMLLFAYYLINRRISIITSALAIILASTLFNAIFIARAVDPSERIDAILSVWDEGEQHSSSVFETNSIGGAALELSSSIGTLIYYLREVPSKYDYAYGRYKLIQLTQVVPGLAGIIIALDIVDLKYKDPSSFATYLIQGEHMRYGNGTNLLGDIYIDFGYSGTLVSMFIIGFFFRKLDEELFNRNNSIFMITAALVYFCGAIMLSRNYMLFYFPLIVMSFVLIKLYLGTMSNGDNKLVK